MLKQEGIIKISVDLMEFIQEIMYLKKTGWGVYVNFDEYADVGTPWIALYCKNDEIIYFDSFGVEYAPKEIEKFIRHKKQKICGYFCIEFIDLVLAGKTYIFSVWFWKI